MLKECKVGDPRHELAVSARDKTDSQLHAPGEIIPCARVNICAHGETRPTESVRWKIQSVVQRIN